MKGRSASVASKQSSSGGLGGAFRQTFGRQDSKWVGDIFKLCRHKVIHMHAGRTGSVLFAQAEDIMGTSDVLTEPSSTSPAAGRRQDVGSFSRFSVVRLTTAGEAQKDTESI